MHCLAENDDLMRLARAAHAEISIAHDEADGFINVPAVTAFSAALELAEEQIGVVDYALKAQRMAFLGALRA
jgi:hypothetical protein